MINKLNQIFVASDIKYKFDIKLKCVKAKKNKY